MELTRGLIVLTIGIILIVITIIYFILTFYICLGAGLILGILCISAGLREHKKAQLAKSNEEDKTE